MEIAINYFDREDNEKKIKVKVDISSHRDGIRPYEYWGFKGYDRGDLWAAIEEVTYDKSELTENEVLQIEEEIASEDFRAKALGKHLDEQQADRDDAAEAAYEARKENNSNY
jgi:hypothetical protein